MIKKNILQGGAMAVPEVRQRGERVSFSCAQDCSCARGGDVEGLCSRFMGSFASLSRILRRTSVGFTREVTASLESKILGYIRTDAELKIIEFSDETADFFHLESEEKTEMNLVDIIPFFREQQNTERLKTVLGGRGKILFGDVKIFSKEAQEVTVKIQVSKIGDGLAFYLIECSLRDILTKRQLLQLLDATNPMCLVNPDYTIARANRSFMELVGDIDVVGKKCCDVLEAESICHNRKKCPVKIIVGQGNVDPVSVKGERFLADGSSVYCIEKATPFFDEKNRVAGVIISITDASRIKAETDLAKQFFKTAGPMCFIDINCRIVRVNEAFLKLVNLSKKEVKGKLYHDIFIGDTCAPDTCSVRVLVGNRGGMIDETADKVRSVTSEALKTRADGSKVLVKVQARLHHGANNRIIGIIASYTDIGGERREHLFRQLVPAQLIPRLEEQKEGPVVDVYEKASVLFADLVNYTKLCDTLVFGEKIVLKLSEIFALFDAVMEEQGLEKIKIIGDSYMAAGNVLKPKEDHPQSMVWAGVAMIQRLQRHCSEQGEQIDIRVGISSGRLVGGVFDREKPFFDLLGITVNMASRMESHGMSGHVQVSEETYKQLSCKEDFQSRMIEIRGKEGKVQTYILNAKERVFVTMR